jgi:hypothetical protein
MEDYMFYQNGNTGEWRQVARLDDLIEIAKRVKHDREYGAEFKIDVRDNAYVAYSTDLYTKDGEYGGFCLLWSDGRGYRALKPYAYKSAAAALRALLNC